MPCIFNKEIVGIYAKSGFHEYANRHITENGLQQLSITMQIKRAQQFGKLYKALV